MVICSQPDSSRRSSPEDRFPAHFLHELAYVGMQPPYSWILTRSASAAVATVDQVS